MISSFTFKLGGKFESTRIIWRWKCEPERKWWRFGRESQIYYGKEERKRRRKREKGHKSLLEFLKREGEETDHTYKRPIAAID